MNERKINQNTKLLEELELGITKSLGLVKALEKSNEFVSYWLSCFSSADFDALDLFEPVLYDASLRFEPSHLYNATYNRSAKGTGNNFCYEWSSSVNSTKRGRGPRKLNIPRKFNDGPIHLCLSHHETDSRDAMFIPTECLLSFKNVYLYNTLKKLTPKGAFPSEFYSESISGGYSPMRSEVTHAVILYDVDQNGDNDISVRWLSAKSLTQYDSTFISLDAIFDNLFDGISVYPFSY